MQSDALFYIVFGCYLAALGLELIGLKRRFAGRRLAIALLTLVGLIAHSIYLGGQGASRVALPLASPAEWLVVFAWVLAVTYLAATLYLPHAATGVLILPLVLGLILLSRGASHEPFAPDRTFMFWGLAHGVLLLLGTVTVCVGFLAGLTYLLQSYALKHAKSPLGGLSLPSLEWLERINSRALGISTLLVAFGCASGLAMSALKHQGDAIAALWTDPTVVSSSAMLLWLAAAEIFRLVYPAARQGRKVAYLTLASFIFVVITVLSLLFLDSGHGM